jgi:DNA polymerase III subunit gamma/tau
MAYTVLARRYRSQSFDEVVGQEPIARTLKAAIEQNKVAHAYLFCGTRGVGKTSTARVFAKALNGGTEEIDTAIMAGQDTDVIEIDGASNRGVDEARELIANSVYRPMRGPYKIYIIDEVHMLTREAFNALLKTMEEPPEHVKFILCTTEAQKVPATIQSRCQRFDFRAISTARIGEHLASVIKSEGLQADAELVHAVARLGNGSMRDALSLLDRLIAAGENKLTTTLLQELLGLPDRELVSTLIDAIATGDAGAALEAADTLLQRGVSIDQLLEVLSDRLRDIMVLCACGHTTTLVELADQTREDEITRAKQFDAAGIVHMIAICESVQRNVKMSASPRALLEAALVRLAMTEKLADVTAVLAGGPIGAISGGGNGAGGGARPKKR